MLLKKRLLGKGVLSLMLGVISIRTFGSEIVKGQNQNNIGVVETSGISKINNTKSLNSSSSYDYEAYSSYSANSFNAYSEGEYVYVPYGNRGKYENYSQGEELYYQNVLSNERWLSETKDSRVKYWGDTKYDIKSINGNDYDYVGEYKRLYSLNSAIGNVYYRDFYKTKTKARYKTKYIHTYHGAYWWNYLLVTVRISDSDIAPHVNNYKKILTTSYLEFQGWDSWEEFDRREYSEWCTSSPWRWAWEPKWNVYSTQEKYKLYLEDIKKWNWQGENKYLKLPSVSLNKDKVNGKDVFGLHLQQWYGISNVDRSKFENQIYQDADPVLDKIVYGNAGRVDYFYFNNEKVFEILLDEIIESRDELKKYIIDDFFWETIKGKIRDEIFSKVLDVILDCVAGPWGEVISTALDVIGFISDIYSICKIYSKEIALTVCDIEMKSKLRNKENLLNNKYTVLKVNQDGYWIDFADDINNPYDDIFSVSLNYSNNSRLNGSLHESSNNLFSNIYGYPTYISSWDTITTAMKEIITEKASPRDFKLSNLVEQGTYSTLFW